jgi:hypothetical protein
VCQACSCACSSVHAHRACHHHHTFLACAGTCQCCCPLCAAVTDAGATAAAAAAAGRAPLHTLALECSCCPHRYVCPYHAAALCECGPREWRLLYRFTLAQLRDKLEDAAGRVGMVSRVGGG